MELDDSAKYALGALFVVALHADEVLSSVVRCSVGLLPRKP